MLALGLIFYGFRGDTSHGTLVALWLSPAAWLARKEYRSFRSHSEGVFRRALFLVGVPLVLFHLTFGPADPGPDADVTAMTAAALVVNGKADISPWTGQQFKDQVDCSVVVHYPVRCTKEGVFADKSLALALPLPFFQLAHWAGADLRRPETLRRISQWTAAWSFAIGGTLLFLFVTVVVPKRRLSRRLRQEVRQT